MFVIDETKKKMLEAIGQDSYNGVNLFEGTVPINKAGSPDAPETPSSPLAGVNPGDPGVDISSPLSDLLNINIIDNYRLIIIILLTCL